MKKLQLLCKKYGGVLAALVLAFGFSTVNTCCCGWIHQPVVPEEMMRARKAR